MQGLHFAADGTHPVGDALPLSLTLTIVKPFYFNFAPYFLTFQDKTCELTLNRFHCDAKGWTSQGVNAKIDKRTTIITPFLMNTKAQKNQYLRKGVIPTNTYIIVY